MGKFQISNYKIKRGSTCGAVLGSLGRCFILRYRFESAYDFGDFDPGFVVSGDQFVVFVLYQPVFASFGLDSKSPQRLAGKEGQSADAADPEPAEATDFDSWDAVVGGAEFIALCGFDGQRDWRAVDAGAGCVFDRPRTDGVIFGVFGLGGMDFRWGVEDHALGDGGW